MAEVTKKNPKGAGRKPGAVSKVKKGIVEGLFAKYPNYNPLIEMLKCAESIEMKAGERAKIHADVAQYIVPKMKALELSGDDKLVKAMLLSQVRSDGSTL